MSNQKQKGSGIGQIIAIATITPPIKGFTAHKFVKMQMTIIPINEGVGFGTSKSEREPDELRSRPPVGAILPFPTSQSPILPLKKGHREMSIFISSSVTGHSPRHF